MSKFLTCAALAAVLAAPSVAADIATAASVRDKALHDPTAWNILTSLTTEIGPRPVGSANYERSRDWAVAMLKSRGFTNIKIETFAKESWQRGAESTEVVAPCPQKLAILGLGNTIPTPPDGIEAPIVVVPTYKDLIAAAPGAFAGKIVVVTQKMRRAIDGRGYGEAVVIRNADGEAAKRGAVAYLIRSVSTANDRAPHTGAIWGDNVGKIPAAALSPADADQLERMAALGPVRLRLKLDSTRNPNTMAFNISGEIPGSEKPGEIVVIGGHIDSWDPGTGAIDDAAGIAITAGAGALIANLPRHPKRTIRVVIWGSEENGGSSDAYAAAHKNENIVIAGESDLGSDRALTVALPGRSAKKLPAAKLLKRLKVAVLREPAKDGGSDIHGLQKAGVPILSVGQDATRYFDIHHSANDTLAAVDRATLNQNVAVWASLIYLVADSDIDFRATR